MARDIVCGMDVDPATARYSSEYGGQTYYFCAQGCKKVFDENPEKYISSGGMGGHEGGHHGHEHH